MKPRKEEIYFRRLSTLVLKRGLEIRMRNPGGGSRKVLRRSGSSRDIVEVVHKMQYNHGFAVFLAPGFI